MNKSLYRCCHAFRTLKAFIKKAGKINSKTVTVTDLKKKETKKTGVEINDPIRGSETEGMVFFLNQHPYFIIITSLVK